MSKLPFDVLELAELEEKELEVKKIEEFSGKLFGVFLLFLCLFFSLGLTLVYLNELAIPFSACLMNQVPFGFDCNFLYLIHVLIAFFVFKKSWKSF